MRDRGEMREGSSPISVVMFERLTGEIARVLRDVGCPHADTAGVLFVPPWAATESRSGVLGAAVRVELDAVLASSSGRFALLDLYCGSRDPLASRPLSGLSRPPECLVDNPIGLVDWLSTLHETLAIHSQLLTYLASSDPDEILPFIPYHPKGPDFSLDGLSLAVPAATIVIAVEARLGVEGDTENATLMLPNGVAVALERR